MLIYLIRRLLIAIPTLFGITIVTFTIISLAPGDPAQFQTQNTNDPRMSRQAYEQLRKYYGLDQPIHVRYVQWMKRLARLDFGESMSTDRLPVATKIRQRLWPTMSLALIAIVGAMTLAIPIGIYSAARQNGLFDSVVSTVLYALYAVPSYVMAVPLILFIGVRWDLLPFQGMQSIDHDLLSPTGRFLDYLRHYALISFCFIYPALAYDSRFIRQNMLETIRQDYVRTARAKGLGEFVVVVRHAFRNTLIPLMTLLGLLLPDIIGGSVILETMFNWPGMGRLLFDSMLSRDYPTIMAISLITATLVLLGTLLADLSYALVDPRVTYE